MINYGKHYKRASSTTTENAKISQPTKKFIKQETLDAH